MPTQLYLPTPMGIPTLKIGIDSLTKHCHQMDGIIKVETFVGIIKMVMAIGPMQMEMEVGTTNKEMAAGTTKMEMGVGTTKMEMAVGTIKMEMDGINSLLNQTSHEHQGKVVADTSDEDTTVVAVSREVVEMVVVEDMVGSQSVVISVKNHTQ